MPISAELRARLDAAIERRKQAERAFRVVVRESPFLHDDVDTWRAHYDEAEAVRQEAVAACEALFREAYPEVYRAQNS